MVSHNPLSGKAPAQINVNWVGKSGTPYTMRAYPIGTTFNSVSGVYIFCRETTPGRWTPLYIGEADDLDVRVGSGREQHHKWAACIRAGATHICALVVSGGKPARLRVETDLRHKYNTPHNDQ